MGEIRSDQAGTDDRRFTFGDNWRRFLDRIDEHRLLMAEQSLKSLLGREDLPSGIDWKCVPISYEELDDATKQLNLRRHHALDDARALRQLVMHTAA